MGHAAYRPDGPFHALELERESSLLAMNSRANLRSIVFPAAHECFGPAIQSV